MHFYAPKDYITGTDLYQEYNPQALQECMSALSPEKVNIVIANKNFVEEELTEVEPWFNTKYSREEIPKDWVETWKSIKPLPEYSLPEPNIFISTDFSLIPLPQDVPDLPRNIYSDALSEVWYRPDPKFRFPECYMNFFLISPQILMSPQK